MIDSRVGRQASSQKWEGACFGKARPSQYMRLSDVAR